jgi:hypothetical protein
MTQKCHHCGQWKKNKQAIRAHLKHCEKWKASEAKALRDQAQLLKQGAAPTHPVRRFRTVAEILGTSAGHRNFPMCAQCGVRSLKLACRCGGDTWLDAKSEPRQCPGCARWIATASRGAWDGRCEHCGGAISEGALRADNADLRARLRRIES